MYIDRDGLIALHKVAGVGWHTINKLAEAGWSFEREITANIIEKVSGYKIPRNTIKNIQECWGGYFKAKIEKEHQKNRIGIITILDSEYPPLLKEITQPPWVLYYKGDLSLLQNPALAMVGTRRPTPYGLKVTQQLAQQLSLAGWTIVSGMASGIDGVAHRSVLKVKGKTIAVLGSGIDVIYPKNHGTLYNELITEGVVISEMPPGTAPQPGLFPQRNRIISGLSYGTVVIEAAEKSGSLITANFSTEEGREVFAVPGPITSEKSGGTNSLIQQGAKCITKVEDILVEFPYIVLNPLRESSKDITPQDVLTKQEKELLTHINLEPIQITELMERVSEKLSIGETHQFLLALEAKGKIHQLPGSSYVIV